ncbi:M20 family metallopeptidase [Clostridium sp. D2Q-14]|nr:M20 family metallopeptidase [Anaeromonas gelatinilytica]
MINRVEDIISEIREDLIGLSRYILNNPELGYEEYKSSKKHIDILKKCGFNVEEKYMGMDTAFRAEYDSGKEGPTIAYLAEYDALPDIGHGCGHNLLGTVSTGSGIVLKKLLDNLSGKVLVIGTPAEETSGAKVRMVDGGAFDDVDIALMAHPSDFHEESGTSLALEAIQFTFRGKTAHAAASPEKGINALDAAINTFNNINALREHIRSDARVHGVIIEGGSAANIVPDLAICQFYVRATTKEYLIELSKKIKNCAKGASLAAGTELEITNYELSYDNMITNRALSKIYNERIKDMGVEYIKPFEESTGSLDMGNVSHVCPAIHPYFGIADREITGHTRELAKATDTELAYDSAMKAIGALVLTAIDIIENKNLLEEVKKEFENTKR